MLGRATITLRWALAHILVSLWVRMGPWDRKLDAAPMGMGNFGERDAHCKYRET